MKSRDDPEARVRRLHREAVLLCVFASNLGSGPPRWAIRRAERLAKLLAQLTTNPASHDQKKPE